MLIFLAINGRPGGYDWADIPDAFVRVIARVVNLRHDAAPAGLASRCLCRRRKLTIARPAERHAESRVNHP